MVRGAFELSQESSFINDITIQPNKRSIPNLFCTPEYLYAHKYLFRNKEIIEKPDSLQFCKILRVIRSMMSRISTPRNLFCALLGHDSITYLRFSRAENVILDKLQGALKHSPCVNYGHSWESSHSNTSLYRKHMLCVSLALQSQLPGNSGCSVLFLKVSVSVVQITWLLLYKPVVQIGFKLLCQVRKYHVNSSISNAFRVSMVNHSDQYSPGQCSECLLKNSMRVSECKSRYFFIRILSIFRYYRDI